MLRPCVLCALILAFVLYAQQPKQRSVLDGVYTDAQAERGALAYTHTCAECHDLSFDGTPVEGEGFIDNWREFPLQTLYDFILHNMPQDNPGELGKDGSRDVLAYLLRRNGYPKGSSELTEDVIKSVRMVGLDGPKPLASETMIKVAGCVAKGPDNTWDLTQAGELTRIRKPDPATPDEIQEASAAPAGTQKLKLLNTDAVSAGQKVLVKGVYVKDSYGARVSAMVVEKLTAECVQR